MHTVKRLWVREEKRGPVIPRKKIELVAGEGVVGDHKFRGRRHVTIVFEDDWAAACADLGRAVDPSARRANVLVTGGSGNQYLGKKLRLGEAEIEIRGTVDPCDRMDEAADGLQAALRPGDRAGIWGVVLQGAQVRVGAALTGTSD